MRHVRKFFLIILIISLSLPLLGNTQSSIDGILLEDFPVDSHLSESLTLRSRSVLGEIILLPKGPFDQNEAAFIITRLDQLPTSILKKINQQHIKIKLFEGKLTDNPTAKHLSGLIPRGYEGETKWDDVPGVGGTKTVLVKIGASTKGNGHGSVNLELHELAHSVDRYVYNEIRYNPSFIKIWKEERGNLFPGKSYFINLPEEYFAETFAMYFLGQETNKELKTKAPRTYKFFAALN